MATIKQNLMNGIKNKDWKLVAEAYEGLTGEKLTVEPEHIFNMKDKSRPKIIVPEDDDEQSEGETEKVPCRTEDITKSPRFNMWHDDGKEALNDKKFDRLAKPEYLTKKGSRGNVSLVKAKCAKCKKMKDTHPDCSTGFICDSCTKGIGE